MIEPWKDSQPTMRGHKKVHVHLCGGVSQLKALCGTPVCARMRSVALVGMCKALPVRREMGWGRWMGGRFTLLLSLCSLPVCLNLPTTTHPLITLLPSPSLPHCLFLLFLPFHPSSITTVIHLSIFRPQVDHFLLNSLDFFSPPWAHLIKSCLLLSFCARV